MAGTAAAICALLVCPVSANTCSTSMPLEELQSELGWTQRVAHAESIAIGDGTNRLRLFPGLRRTEINGLTVWLHNPFQTSSNGDSRLNAVDVAQVLRPILQATNSTRRSLRVMLDPGHGGEDGGAVAFDGRWQESHFTLDLAWRIRKRLERQGFVVGCTREDDRFVSLDERTATAAVWRAHVFVSLHANYAHNHEATGRETYVLPVEGGQATAEDSRLSARFCLGNSNNVLNTLLGFSIHRQLPGRLQSADRGLRRARYQVLRDAPCPAALVECGFLSNSNDVKLLSGGWYRDRLARAIADGIADYARMLPDMAYDPMPPTVAPEVTTNDLPETATNEAPEAATNDMPVAATNDALEAVTNDIPKTSTYEAPEAATNVVPGKAEEATAKPGTNAIPVEAVNPSPATTNEAAPTEAPVEAGPAETLNSERSTPNTQVGR
ncbi:MAG: N-acetylmuramoyl-L-alanine amidase [Kiritimatiellae bacterium]|nr:N-acetylmuramoyl-L-alanine amidase [Kiritimatiellia bacterium]